MESGHPSTATKNNNIQTPWWRTIILSRYILCRATTPRHQSIMRRYLSFMRRCWDRNIQPLCWRATIWHGCTVRRAITKIRWSITRRRWKMNRKRWEESSHHGDHVWKNGRSIYLYRWLCFCYVLFERKLIIYGKIMGLNHYTKRIKRYMEFVNIALQNR